VYIRATKGYVPGEYNVICHRCGGKYKSSQVRFEWTGLRVCFGPNTRECWDPKHPQLDIRGIPDIQSLPWTRKEPAETSSGACSAEGLLGIAGYAVADCWIVEYTETAATAISDIPESTFNLNTL